MLYKGRKFNFDVNYLCLFNGVEGDWECICYFGGVLCIFVILDGKLVLVK